MQIGVGLFNNIVRLHTGNVIIRSIDDFSVSLGDRFHRGEAFDRFRCQLEDGLLRHGFIWCVKVGVAMVLDQLPIGLRNFGRCRMQ